MPENAKTQELSHEDRLAANSRSTACNSETPTESD